MTSEQFTRRDLKPMAFLKISSYKSGEIELIESAKSHGWRGCVGSVGGVGSVGP